MTRQLEKLQPDGLQSTLVDNKHIANYLYWSWLKEEESVQYLICDYRDAECYVLADTIYII